MNYGDKYERFEAWLRENGGQFDMLELREYHQETASKGMQDHDYSNYYHSRHDDDGDEEKKEPQAFIEGSSNDSDNGGDSEMRSVHAKTHIPPNTTCMVIPRKCLITVEMGQNTPIGQKILMSDLDLDAPKHIYLMIYLLWDRKRNGNSSFYAPYYDILPPTLSNMPIFWSPAELQYLEGSYLLAQIEDRKDAIREDYDSICAIAPELADLCTLQEFSWARMCVCSRNFGLQMDGQRTSALVPHADMLNHYRPRETKWTFDDEIQAFTITSLQSIPAGAQVYDSYGQKCNHRFLLNYGFAVEDNREIDGFCPNEVPIELSISRADPLYEQRLDFWTRGEAARHEDSLRKRVRICVSNNENTRLLFSLLRALVCDEDELKAATTSLTHDGAAVTRALFGMAADARAIAAATSSSSSSSLFYRSCRDIRHPVSLRNERAAMKHLMEVVGRSLSKYPTTLAQDIADLLDEETYPRFSNKRHAKIQVRGEKEVLHHFLTWAQTALEVLDILEQELVEESGGGRSVEVQLTPRGRGVTTTEVVRPSFETVIRRMEEDEGSCLHHTIVRYCCDVLGSLRREELKSVRRQRAVASSSGPAMCL